MKRHRIILTGGGTGGHVYPALAVAEQLSIDNSVESLLYIGSNGHIEERLAAANKIPFVGLTVSGMPRKLSPAMFKWPFELGKAIGEAKKALREFKPTAILATGGYASAAPLMAAKMKSIPYAIHEPDAHPGLVNRLFASQATLVSLGMEGAKKYLKPNNGQVIFNGNPLRKSFMTLLARDSACAVLGLNPELKTVLVTGGSQGAQAINEALFAALPLLLEAEPHIQIIHQVGDKNLQDFKQRLSDDVLHNPRYLLRAYFDDLASLYVASDLAVCRAGAMTVAELAATGTPALFIPYPYAAADHQTYNARFVESLGAASVIMQNKLNAQILKDQIISLLVSSNKLKTMRRAMLTFGKPKAAIHLAEQVKAMSTDYIAMHSLV